MWWFVDFEVCWMLEWASVGILSPIKGLSHFGLGCFLRFSGLVDLWFGGYLRFSWPLDPLRFGWLWGLIDFKAWLTFRFGWLLGLVDFEADVRARAVTSPIQGLSHSPIVTCHLLEMPAPPTSHLTLPQFVIQISTKSLLLVTYNQLWWKRKL